MNAAMRQQVAVRPTTKVVHGGVSYLRGHLEGYEKGRNMSRLVERQRSDLLHAMESVLATGDIAAAHTVARRAIDAVGRCSTSTS